MDNTWAQWIVGLAGIYTVLGFLFALAFVRIGIRQIDPAAKDSPLGFRLLIFPGVVALWPLLARRWLGRQAKPPQEQNTHRSEAVLAAQATHPADNGTTSE